MSELDETQADPRPRDRTVVAPAVQAEFRRAFRDVVGMEVGGISVSIMYVDYD